MTPAYSFMHILYTIRLWWWLLVESHYLMSSDIEDEISYKAQDWREREDAKQNASYFVLKAAEVRAKLNRRK